MHRLLRLKRPLVQTIGSHEWICDVKFSNKKLKSQIEKILRCDQFWDTCFSLVVILFPCIKTLRLSDSNKPGMDKIFYFTRITTLRLNKLAHKIDTVFDEDVMKCLLDPDENSNSDYTRDSEDMEELTDFFLADDLNNAGIATGDDDDNIDLNFLVDECITDDDDMETTQLSSQMMSLWKKRARQVSSDFAISASPPQA